MKIVIIFAALVLLLSSGSLTAQDIQVVEQKNKMSQPEVKQIADVEARMLEKLQHETEDISVMKPFLFIAAIIDSRLALHRLEKESIAAAKSRDTGVR